MNRPLARILLAVALVGTGLSLQGCIVGSAVKLAGDVAVTGVKVTGAVVETGIDIVTPGEDGDKDKKKDD